MAAWQERVDLLERLYEKGADVNVVDKIGRSALYYAAHNGNPDVVRWILERGGFVDTQVGVYTCTNDVPCLTLNFVGRKVRQINKFLESLTIYWPCVRILVNHGCNLAAVTKTGVTVIDAIFAHIPRPLAFLTDILDSCVRTVNNSPLEKDENITVDFSILAPKHQMQMAVVTAVIVAASGIAQLAILQHPLVETFLRLKWARLRILFFVLLLVHLIFVIFLSIYAVMLVRDDPECVAIRRILLISSCILLIHNMIQVLLEPKHYLRQLETWLSLVCATLTLITSVAGEFFKCDVKSRDCWVLHSISIAILLSWMQMMLLIGRFPMCGYYALMFSTVLKNILKVLLAFGYLIVGFALSFSVLFHRNEQFSDFWMSLVRTVVMMMGEYEYEDLLSADEKGKAAFLPITSRIVFFIFILLASIVLINLMIGLAVNDIQALEREGHIRRLLKQAEFVAHLERVTSHKIFRSNWLHPRFKMLLHSRRDIPTKIMLTSRENYFPHMSHITDSQRVICADLIEPLLQLATKTSFQNDNLTDKNIWDTKLSSMLINLEDQIRELKTHCYRSLVNQRASKICGFRIKKP
ncbi:Transient receptor potential channel pyrexia [Ooceraea biroi]|uniref:Transient receptor potential channel pyrexia n=1 Tax=Ooceraea biroi TaxID=2015173 RepID=A0A026WBL6_OOCBI|nr:Transient receptor potential channel pyrexia [Ooceraea biroi]